MPRTLVLRTAANKNRESSKATFHAEIEDSRFLYGSKATWFFVLAYTEKEARYKGMTGFIVPADTPGTEIGRK